MTRTTPETIDGTRIPVICVDWSSVAGAEIFNPNAWSSASKGIIRSCWTEYSVLHYCSRQITAMCQEAEPLCQKHIETIQGQWRLAKVDLHKIVIFGEVPDLHIRIEAFFSGVKTLLDLLVQLLSSEKVVGVKLDGFHRVKNIYGGKVLNALAKNAVRHKEPIARKIRTLVTEHKTLWINEVIQARDWLIHPEMGIHQLTFQLEFIEEGSNLVCTQILRPTVGTVAIDEYAERVLQHVQIFTSLFLGLLREAATSP